MWNLVKDPKQRNVLKNIHKIKGFKICFYEDKRHTPPKLRPFLAFCINKTSYFFDAITTQFEARRNHHLNTNPKALGSLVEICPEDTNGILNELCLIDCNENELMEIKDIVYSMGSDIFIVDDRDLPKETIERIKVAIIESPHTSPDQKKFAKMQ